MKLNMGGITIDCANPRSLAEFWTKALDLEVAFDADGYFVQLRSPANPAQPYLGLQMVAEPRAGKNRVHIDFSAPDLEAEVTRLVGLGATETGRGEAGPEFRWVVFADPDGNAFCVAGGDVAAAT